MPRSQKPVSTTPEAAVEAAVEATPTPEVEATETEVETIFTIGKIPKLGSNNMHDTARTWEFLATELEAGPLTVKALQKLAKDEFNHASFVKYAVKNGWYTPTTLEAEAAKVEAAAAKVEAAAAKAAEK